MSCFSEIGQPTSSPPPEMPILSPCFSTSSARWVSLSSCSIGLEALLALRLAAAPRPWICTSSLLPTGTSIGLSATASSTGLAAGSAFSAIGARRV